MHSDPNSKSCTIFPVNRRANAPPAGKDSDYVHTYPVPTASALDLLEQRDRGAQRRRNIEYFEILEIWQKCVRDS